MRQSWKFILLMLGCVAFNIRPDNEFDKIYITYKIYLQVYIVRVLVLALVNVYME